jgi:uncharacterized membrane protein
MTLKSLLFLLLVLIVGYASVKMKKLTVAGALAGAVLAVFIFLGTGFNGIAMIGLFFLLGTLATAWKRRVKEAIVAGDDESGGRTAGQVIANGGVAGVMGLLAWIFPAGASYMQAHDGGGTCFRHGRHFILRDRDRLWKEILLHSQF